MRNKNKLFLIGTMCNGLIDKIVCFLIIQSSDLLRIKPFSYILVPTINNHSCPVRFCEVRVLVLDRKKGELCLSNTVI